MALSTRTAPKVDRRLPRDLYLAAGARAGSILGNAVAVTTLLLAFHDRGAGAWAVAAVLAAGVLPIVLLAPVVGFLVDRYDSRMLIMASSGWQAAACLLLAFVGAPQIALVLVAVNAFGTALSNPLLLALTRVLVPSRQLAAANGVQQGTATIATVAGPAVSGLLTGLTGGARVPLLLDAALFIAIGGVGLLIGTRRRPAGQGPKTRARNGIALLFGDRALAAMVVLAVVNVPVVHLIYVAQVFLVRDTFGASALAFGLLQTTQMVGLLIGTAVASRLDTARRILRTAPLAAAVMSLSILLIGVLQSLPATFVLYAIAGVSTSVVSVSVVTMLLLRTPEPVTGRAMASFTAMHRAGSLIAYGVGGLIVGLVPPEAVYLLSGAGAVLVTLITAPALYRAAAIAPGRRTPG